MTRFLWGCWLAALSLAAPAVAQPGTLPVVFSLQGIPGELSSQTNGAVITPAIEPAGMSGQLVLLGKGTINFLPQGGVWFGLGGQQRADSGRYQFTGPGIQTLFDPFAPADVSFTWTSHYSFADRQALATQTGNRNIFRIAFEVFNDTSSQFILEVTVQDGYLAFVSQVSNGKGTYYFVPQGTEDALFGQNVPLQVRLGMGWHRPKQPVLQRNPRANPAVFPVPAPPGPTPVFPSVRATSGITPAAISAPTTPSAIFRCTTAGARRCPRPRSPSPRRRTARLFPA